MCNSDVHKPCPHCQTLRKWLWLRGVEKLYIRCPGCRCRWDVHGELTVWGRRCPVLVVQPAPGHPRKLNVGVSGQRSVSNRGLLADSGKARLF